MNKNVQVRTARAIGLGSFRGRALRSIVIVLGLALAAMTGCTLLPYPHREWLSPPASGRVLDAATQQPIPDALVMRYEPEKAAVGTRTDAEGNFELPGQRVTRWCVAVDYMAVGRYRILATNYHRYQTNLAGGAWKEYLRHDLGDVRLQAK
jgi:hypothetical protein